MMLKARLFFLFLLLFLGVKVIYAASVRLDYSVPEGWRKDRNAEERWLGPDPTVSLKRGPARIMITHYGLVDSRYASPDEFLPWLRSIFDPNDFTSVEDVKVAGRDGKRVKLYYETADYTSFEGTYIPAEYTYEEFIIFSVEEGFYVLTLTIKKSVFSPTQEVIDSIRDLSDKEFSKHLRIWENFLKSCEITEGEDLKMTEKFGEKTGVIPAEAYKAFLDDVIASYEWALDNSLAAVEGVFEKTYREIGEKILKIEDKYGLTEKELKVLLKRLARDFSEHFSFIRRFTAEDFYRMREKGIE